MRFLLMVAAALAAMTVAAAAQPPAPPPLAPDVTLPPLRVIAPTRLPGDPLPASSIPATIDVIPGETLRATGVATLQRALERLPGVTLTDQQGNAHQFRHRLARLPGDVRHRRASGRERVRRRRARERAHGRGGQLRPDPLDDIDRIELIRGPSAAFGRNTLGGALNIITRRGERGRQPHPEVVGEIEAGSFGRQKYRIRVGGGAGPIDYYVAGSWFREDGWRDVSASRLGKLFGKVGFEHQGTDVTLSYQHAENRIEQPGSLPESELRRDRTQNFTGGDFFKPLLSQGTLNVRQELGDRLALAVNGFVRSLYVEQFNANLVADNTRSFFDTLSAGGTVQVTHQGEIFGRRNRLVVGVDYLHADVNVKVFEEEADGAVGLDSRVRDNSDALGIYLEDTMDVARDLLVRGDALVVTGSVRYDWLRHDIRDRNPDPDRPSATQDSRFQRANPRVGVNYNVSPALGFFFTYGEGFRAPAFLELTCATPATICPGLQAGVASDPPLDPVKVRSYEAGVRGRPLPWLTGELSLFRTDVIDDIFSVSPTGTVGLFFQNVGDTRREGVELGVRAHVTRTVDAWVNYAYTEATLRDDVELGTPRQTEGCAGGLCSQVVRKGSELPLVPRHRLNAGVTYFLLPWLHASLSARYVGTQRLRGDEENVERPLPDYVVFDAGLKPEGKGFTAFVAIENLFNSEYETFGTFAPNGRLPGAPVERFLTPGAPLHVTGGLSYRF